MLYLFVIHYRKYNLITILKLSTNNCFFCFYFYRSDEGMNGTPPPVPPPPNPPPLPPRTSAIHRASSSSDQLRLSANIDSKDGVSPRRLSSSNDLRNGGTSPRDSGKGSDPPLPPRNRISQNLDLNLVVPVAPGGADKRYVTS